MRVPGGRAAGVLVLRIRRRQRGPRAGRSGQADGEPDRGVGRERGDPRRRAADHARHILHMDKGALVNNGQVTDTGH